MLRLLFKVGVTLLSVIAAFASDERKPRYTAIHAQELHDEDMISDQEYGRALRGHDNY